MANEVHGLENFWILEVLDWLDWHTYAAFFFRLVPELSGGVFTW